MTSHCRNTKQRRVIFEELARLDSHPTAGELYAIVRRTLPHISLGTVYRNLDRLVEAGQAKKIEGGSQVRYDADMAAHDHMRCVVCERVLDLPAPSRTLGEQLLDQVKGLADGEILGLKVEIVGICPDCRKRLSPHERAEILHRWQS